MSKFLSDRWMVQNGFIQETDTPAVKGKTVRDLIIEPATTCPPEITVRQCLQLLKDNKVSEMPVVDNGIIIGVASSAAINKRLIEGFTVLDDNIIPSLAKVLKCMTMDTTIAFVNTWLEDLKYAVVQDGEFIGLIYPTHISNLLASA
jgi:cystathionine beta-synthase